MIGWLIGALLALGAVVCVLAYATGSRTHMGYLVNWELLLVGLALVAAAVLVALGYGLYKAFS